MPSSPHPKAYAPQIFQGDRSLRAFGKLTISLLIMWLVSRANLRSLPESFFRRRFEECVRLSAVAALPARRSSASSREEPIPLRFVRRFPPYHEIPERRDGRAAVVALHADGWSAKAISGYLEVGTSIRGAGHDSLLRKRGPRVFRAHHTERPALR